MSNKQNNQLIKKSLVSKPSTWILGAIISLTLGVLNLPQQATAAGLVVYKSPTCGCCKGWVDHMRANGFDVEVQERDDVSPIKRKMGVPQQLQSCHTAKVEDYVIEGHVPAADVKRLLKEKPDVVGLTAPGMPIGSPGMEMGPRKDPYDVLTFKKSGQTAVFASHNRH